jgi:hypothetical protein
VGCAEFVMWCVEGPRFTSEHLNMHTVFCMYVAILTAPLTTKKLFFTTKSVGLLGLMADFKQAAVGKVLNTMRNVFVSDRLTSHMYCSLECLLAGSRMVQLMYG